MLQRNTSLPDESNVVRLQEELIAVKLREAEALTGLKELRQQVRDLEEHWQVYAHSQTHNPHFQVSVDRFVSIHTLSEFPSQKQCESYFI